MHVSEISFCLKKPEGRKGRKAGGRRGGGVGDRGRNSVCLGKGKMVEAQPKLMKNFEEGTFKT